MFVCSIFYTQRAPPPLRRGDGDDDGAPNLWSLQPAVEGRGSRPEAGERENTGNQVARKVEEEFCYGFT
jgi:hypothetical protein